VRRLFQGWTISAYDVGIAGRRLSITLLECTLPPVFLRFHEGGGASQRNPLLPNATSCP